VPRRIANEEAAVKAALTGNTTNVDLAALGVYRADGTVNVTHPLLSTLKAELPVMKMGAPAAVATELRRRFERPPYGWDGNAVKVGLALLLGESLCCLIENGRTLTDPQDRDVLTCLTKEKSFENVRVQGTDTAGPSMDELKAVRAAIEVLFGEKPPLVPATLNASLGEALTHLEERAAEAEAWAGTADCPLPQTFVTGHSLAQELLDLSTPSARLARFGAESARLTIYSRTLDEVEQFRQEHGSQYREVSTFFNRVLNATGTPQDVTQFVGDWRTVRHERTVTDPARWSELLEAYHVAGRALTDGAQRLHGEIAGALDENERTLPERLTTAGVPDEERAERVDTMGAPFREMRQRLSPELDFFALSQMDGELRSAKLRLDMALMQLKAERPTRRVRQGTFALYDLVPQQEITLDSLDSFLLTLREALEVKLATQESIVIE
jgi:hypothetical protein